MLRKKYTRRNPIETRQAVFPVGPSIAYIVLSDGKLSIVDWDDALWLQKHNWSVALYGRDWYSNGYINGKSIGIGRAIMNPPQGKQVDHKNFNTLDNRRANLRICEDHQNKANRGLFKNSTTGFRGVHFLKHRNKYKVTFRHMKVQYFLGYFTNIEDANNVYTEKSKAMNGEFYRDC